MPISITIIAALVIFLMIAIEVAVEFGKRNKRLKRDVEELENAISDKNKSIAFLLKHAEELANIQMYENTIKDKIEEAKSDEEISDIVASIISANNSIVQDNQDGGE